MSELEKVFNIIDGYRDEIISLQTELTSRVALGPKNKGTGEHDKALYLRGCLEALRPDDLEHRTTRLHLRMCLAWVPGPPSLAGRGWGRVGLVEFPCWRPT